MVNKDSGLARFDSLFNTFSLSNRMVFDADEIMTFNGGSIAYDNIDCIVEIEKAK